MPANANAVGVGTPCASVVTFAPFVAFGGGGGPWALLAADAVPAASGVSASASAVAHAIRERFMQFLLVGIPGLASLGTVPRNGIRGLPEDPQDSPNGAHASAGWGETSGVASRSPRSLSATIGKIAVEQIAARIRLAAVEERM